MYIYIYMSVCMSMLVCVRGTNDSLVLFRKHSQPKHSLYGHEYADYQILIHMS